MFDSLLLPVGCRFTLETPWMVSSDVRLQSQVEFVQERVQKILQQCTAIRLCSKIHRALGHAFIEKLMRLIIDLPECGTASNANPLGDGTSLPNLTWLSVKSQSSAHLHLHGRNLKTSEVEALHGINISLDLEFANEHAAQLAKSLESIRFR